jgi:hypothetical protein
MDPPKLTECVPVLPESGNYLRYTQELLGRSNNKTTVRIAIEIHALKRQKFAAN